MNRNDPERARCSAPEEEYDAPITPESAADARTRKHLRVWVRRLQCNEQFESRLPTMTRGKKRSVVNNSKELETLRQLLIFISHHPKLDLNPYVLEHLLLEIK